MSGGSSSAVAWYSRLEPAETPSVLSPPDDPRLANVIERWRGDAAALRPGRAVLVGFPVDEGVRRNGGRVGAADAPNEVRKWLIRLTPRDGASGTDLGPEPPLDAGNIRPGPGLEGSQVALGEIVAGLLTRGAVPVVIGGGHETAYGHFLGYAQAGKSVGIVNLDAHLDVRSWSDGLGHSGSPFRQAMEHSSQAFQGRNYVCLGAQSHSVSHAHFAYAVERGARVAWCEDVRNRLVETFASEVHRLARDQCQIYVTVDADVVAQADVPGVSAPNPSGLAGAEVLRLARTAGRMPAIASFELVEINPRLDRDGQSARWGALVIWQFLMGLADRARQANT
jgi:formiminoglutamase